MKDNQVLCRQVGRALADKNSKVKSLDVLGFDPSVKTGAAATVRLNVRTGTVEVTKLLVARGLGSSTPRPLTTNVQRGLAWVSSGNTVAFVEDQKVRESGKGKTKNPQNLIPLAQAAGVAFGTLNACTYGVAYVQAHEWKGSMSKPVSHRQICRRLKWDSPIAMSGYLCPRPVHYSEVALAIYNPDGSRGKLLKSDWHELMDAIGIALWGAEKVRVAYKTAKYVRKGH